MPTSRVLTSPPLAVAGALVLVRHIVRGDWLPLWIALGCLALLWLVAEAMARLPRRLGRRPHDEVEPEPEEIEAMLRRQVERDAAHDVGSLG